MVNAETSLQAVAEPPVNGEVVLEVKAVDLIDTQVEDAVHASNATKKYVLDTFNNTLKRIDSKPPGERNVLRAKLSRCGVNGSNIPGVRSIDEVLKLINASTNWEYKMSAHDEIDVYQAVLPANVLAYTAYATADEIAKGYGEPGTSTIAVKVGKVDYQVYHCTLLEVETNVLTVQVLRNPAGGEDVFQWFAGIDIKVRALTPTKNAGDVLVRCSGKIESKAKQAQKRAERSAKAGPRVN